jgi:predicted DsbA family dithiol-disulfide isomerase
VRLVIYSDLISPWCFVGKRHLDAALTRLGHPPMRVRWRPFQLYPQLPASGVDAAPVLQSRFAGTVGDMDELIRAGELAGIHFDFDALTTVPNTLAAHALVAYSVTSNHQYALVDALFSAFFEHGRDIGRQEVLVDVAANIGMDWSDVSRVLDSDSLRREIKTQSEAAREAGIHGIPTMVLDSRTALLGTRPIEVLTDFLSQGLIGTAPGKDDDDHLSIH